MDETTKATRKTWETIAPDGSTVFYRGDEKTRYNVELHDGRLDSYDIYIDNHQIKTDPFPTPHKAVRFLKERGVPSNQIVTFPIYGCSTCLTEEPIDYDYCHYCGNPLRDYMDIRVWEKEEL